MRNKKTNVRRCIVTRVSSIGFVNFMFIYALFSRTYVKFGSRLQWGRKVAAKLHLKGLGMNRHRLYQLLRYNKCIKPFGEKKL